MEMTKKKRISVIIKVLKLSLTRCFLLFFFGLMMFCLNSWCQSFLLVYFQVGAEMSSVGLDFYSCFHLCCVTETSYMEK